MHCSPPCWQTFIKKTQAVGQLSWIMSSGESPEISSYNRCVPVLEQLRPIQVAFGVAEAAVHSCRKFIINACTYDIIQKNYMQNTFNSLRRDHIHEKGITTCPVICRLVHYAYSTPSALLISDKIIALSSDLYRVTDWSSTVCTSCQ